MANTPLVSVMMPCFNAERTLGMAIASLRAQTYAHWEAVVVDDGSTDGTARVLDAVDDPRIHVARFCTNQGTGAARRHCLDMAEGELLAFLDADDWLFPDKLALQVEAMTANPDVAALGAAAVITDGRGNAVGQTGAAPGVLRFDRLGPPPIGFPPCMVRMGLAKRTGFNPAFRRSQDSDFLIKVMLGRHYAVLGTPLYAYSQAEAASLEKTLEGYRCRRRCYAQYTDRFPVRARTQMLSTLARAGVYRAAGLVGAERTLIERRWKPLTPSFERAFDDAKRKVSRVAEPVRDAS